MKNSTCLLLVAALTAASTVEAAPVPRPGFFSSSSAEQSGFFSRMGSKMGFGGAKPPKSGNVLTPRPQIGQNPHYNIHGVPQPGHSAYGQAPYPNYQGKPTSPHHGSGVHASGNGGGGYAAYGHGQPAYGHGQPAYPYGGHGGYGGTQMGYPVARPAHGYPVYPPNPGAYKPSAPPQPARWR